MVFDMTTCEYHGQSATDGRFACCEFSPISANWVDRRLAEIDAAKRERRNAAARARRAARKVGR